MSSVITYSTSLISNSITNPDVNKSIAVDNHKPFSFLEFITNTKVDYAPEEYNNFYISYLQDWADVKNTAAATETISFVDYYVSFLKEIVITYATNQERKFLSNINFSDPADLDIAIPFFTEKIRQIILFYKSKRDDAKYVIDRNKIKGSSTSIERGLFDSIYSYIFSSQEQPQYLTLGVSLENIVNTLDIDILEYVDVYGNYFDIPLVSDTTSSDQPRTDYYTANINEVDTKLYFSTSYQQIFGSTAFLQEIPLIVNVTLQFNQLCEPDNPLTLVQDSDISGLSTSDVVVYKKKLLEKYLGTDLYYIDTTNNTTVSGLLVTAETPSNNINNLQQANTASVRSNEAILLRNLGLFFGPDSQGVFQLNADNFTYSINTSKLEANKIYVFPDPSKYGNATINSQLDYPLVYIYDYRPDVKNVSSGFASGTPNVQADNQTFSPYYTTEQSRNQAITTNIDLNFNDLYNKGYITKLQYDIYGNSYALFKDEFGQTFKAIENIETDAVKSLLLNGHVFYDNYEGYSFNYDTVSIIGSTFRSGLSTNTIDNNSVLNFSLSNQFYTLFFREFTPYIELLQDTRNITGKFKDGGRFTFEDGVNLPDPLYTNSLSYPVLSAEYYYNELAEGGILSLLPIARPIDGLGGYAANFTLDAKLILSADNVDEYDCGYFSDIVLIPNDNIYNDGIPYIDTVQDYGITVLSTLTGTNDFKLQEYKNQMQGKIFVQEGINTASQPISTALTNTFNKYSSIVQTELYTAPKDLEVFYNTICIETESYLVFDKIMYEDSLFQKPGTTNIVYTINSESTLQAFSNRIFTEKDKTVTFCILYPMVQSISGLITEGSAGSSKLLTETASPLITEDVNNLIAEGYIDANTQTIYSNNNKIFIPEIYQYTIADNTSKKIFPITSQIPTISSAFAMSTIFTEDCNFNIVKIKKPLITYNSLNDIYKLTYICVDNNNLFHLLDYTFNINQDKTVTFIDCRYYNHSKTIRTSDFSNYNFTTVNTLNGTYAISGNQVII